MYRKTRYHVAVTEEELLGVVLLKRQQKGAGEWDGYFEVCGSCHMFDF